MSHDYAVEKLYQAMLSLIGPGDIKARLESAAITLLIRQIETDLPSDLGAELRSIHDALIKDPPEFDEDGRIPATIRKMTPDEASALSSRIFHLYVKALHGSPFT